MSMMQKEFRLMSRVTRWNVVRTVQSQTVSDHSFHVAMLALRMCRDTGLHEALHLNLACILEAALTHDCDEMISADISAPMHRQVKRFSRDTGLKSWVASRMAAWFPWFTETRNDHIRHLVSVCDGLEAVLFLMSEVDLGNKYCLPHLEAILEDLIERLRAGFDPQLSAPARVVQELAGINRAVSDWVDATIADARREARVLS